VSEPGVRRRVAELSLLIIVLALAAFLRFDRLGAPSYWLDEILGDMLTTHVLQAPPWQWITGLEHEHGPLYYATQAATRLAGRDEAAGRLAAALFGLATIPLVFAIASGGQAPRLSGPAGQAGQAGAPVLHSAGIAAAILLAVSPMHVYYSREARPYALLMLLTAVLLVAITRRRVGLGAIALVAMLYTSAVAGPAIAAAAVTLAAAAWIAHDRRLWLLAALAAAMVILVPILYRGHSAAASAPKIDAMKIARALTVSVSGAGGHTVEVAALVLLAIIGAVALARHDRATAAIVVGMTVLPIVVAVASLAAIGHWFAPRYISPALIGFVVLAGSGIASIWSAVAKPPLATALTVALAAILAADTWPAARREAFEKLDWRDIARTLEQHVRPGDAIVTAEQWSDVCLRYYLRHLPPDVRVVAPSDPIVAEIFVVRSPAVWIVTSAGSDRTAVGEWACRYPLLLAAVSPLDERFRLHYAPSARHFVAHRAAPEDLRALAAALGPHVALHVGKDDEVLRGDGWEGPEGAPGEEFRWVIAKEASLNVPRLAPADRRIGVRALPFSNPALPPQTMRVSLNGVAIATVTMPNEWHDYAFDAPASLWREGRNALTFSFSRLNAPAEFPPATDARRMAAAFNRIAIDDGGGGQAGAPVLSVRFASDLLFRTRCAWPSRSTRLPADRLNRPEVEALLARLGFDPATAWPRIARGEVQLEDVAAAVATESGCESDRAFLDRAFAVIVQRKANPGEEADLLPRLRAGATRAAIVERILRAGDLRARLLR
jgi:mannosyltransferase